MEIFNTEVIIAITGVITTIASGWGSWFFARRKYNSEVDNNVIENMKQSLEFYSRLSDDNKSRLEEVLKRNEQLEREVNQLRGQMFELINSICYNVTCELRVKAPKKGISKVKKTCDDVIKEGRQRQ